MTPNRHPERAEVGEQRQHAAKLDRVFCRELRGEPACFRVVYEQRGLHRAQAIAATRKRVECGLQLCRMRRVLGIVDADKCAARVGQDIVQHFWLGARQGRRHNDDLQALRRGKRGQR
jgi:hypothetical protein